MAGRSTPSLIVTFHKVSAPSPHAWWDAERPKGGRIRGGYMPIGRGIIPHDLGHMATEGHLGITDGFWGLLARGATFKRGTDRRATPQGRALVAEHRSALQHAEAVGNHHQWAWATGEPTPVRPTFDRLREHWASTPDGGTLTIRWPSLEVVPSGS